MQRATILSFLLLFAMPASAAPDYSKDPVVMVHGYFLGEVGTWTWMTEKLKDEGWPPEYLYSFQFKNVFGCNPDHGNELKAMVDKALAETGRERVDILCHSMGCVDARYYIKFLCGYERVKDFVSIAGAHKGSTVGCLEPFSCGAAAMCVGPTDGAWMQNEFLFSLNWCDITPGKAVKYTSIWSPLDEIIIPQENSIIEGAWNIKLEALAEHALILTNQETATHVMAGLDGGGKNNNLPIAAPPCVTLCELPDDPILDPVEDVVEPDVEIVEAPADIHGTGPELTTPETVATTDDLAGFDAAAATKDKQGQDKTGTPPSPIETDTQRRTDDADSPAPVTRHPLANRDSGCQAGGRTGSGPLLLLLLVLTLWRRQRFLTLPYFP
jgi:triacylglycerol lipase